MQIVQHFVRLLPFIFVSVLSHNFTRNVFLNLQYHVEDITFVSVLHILAAQIQSIIVVHAARSSVITASLSPLKGDHHRHAQSLVRRACNLSVRAFD